MDIIDIKNLDGGIVHVMAKSVYRVTRQFRAVGDPSYTRVDFNGGYQLTRTSISDIAANLIKTSVHLIEVTAPDDTKVFLNTAQVTSVIVADPHSYPSEARSVIGLGLNKQEAKETQTQVYAMLAQA